MNGPPLTKDDLDDAKAILTHRFSTVVILEDFAHSALQLACTIGLDLTDAKKLFRTRVRPYQQHQAMLQLPSESDIGTDILEQMRHRFTVMNSMDFELYWHAKKLSKRRVAACARRDKRVAEILRLPQQPEELEEHAERLSASEKHPTLDDIFGCVGATLEATEDGSAYLLKCPRMLGQETRSWWDAEGEPTRKLGEKPIGKDCWAETFTWSACCATKFGPDGNHLCWGGGYSYRRCCVKT